MEELRQDSLGATGPHKEQNVFAHIDKCICHKCKLYVYIVLAGALFFHVSRIRGWMSGKSLTSSSCRGRLPACTLGSDLFLGRGLLSYFWSGIYCHFPRISGIFQESNYTSSFFVAFKVFAR